MTSTPYRLRTDLVQRAAGILGIVQVGQDLAPEDAELIDAQVEPTYASLAARGVVYLMPNARIELAIFEELAACLAANVPDYGQALDSAVAEQNIRFMQRSGPSYQTLRVETF